MARFALTALVILALGLPINHVPAYLLLAAAVILVATGQVLRDIWRWSAGVVLVACAMLGGPLVAPPLIDEGHNVFAPARPDGALEHGLPAAAFAPMRDAFDARYPASNRCDVTAAGCWQNGAGAARTFASSADGLWQRALLSRRVSDVDFDDAVWLRIGAFNELRYHWYDGVSDVRRVERRKHNWDPFSRWRVAMPWFVMYRFPADYVGSDLCWRGAVLWEGAGEQFEHLDHAEMRCRALAPADIGRRIFGVAIADGPPLAMHLRPPALIRIRELADLALRLLAVVGSLALLLRPNLRRAAMPTLLAALALAVVVLVDGAFVGGWRPLDGGDDGLTYEGLARIMLQRIADGDIGGAFEGGEPVFFFTPGLRYLLVIERYLFGDTHLGYLSLLLIFPPLVFALFRRFLPVRWALVLVLVFVLTPLGALFGSSFFLYAKWAVRGFADPAAFVLLVAGLVVLAGRTNRPSADPGPALGAALLFALTIFVRPNLVPFVGVVLAFAGWHALRALRLRYLVGLCAGFLPVFAMALHNWVYGHVFVLFGSNATHASVYVMPPSVAFAGLKELAAFDLHGANVRTLGHQILAYLAGPSEFWALAPVHAAALLFLAWFVVRPRTLDPWMRAIALGILVQSAVSLVFAIRARYFYGVWLLAVLVIAVWLREVGLALVMRRYPALRERLARHPLVARFGSGLGVLERLVPT